MKASELEISQRQLKEAKRSAELLASRAKNLYATDQVTDWASLARRLGVEIPTPITALEWTYASISTFCTYWVQGFEARLRCQLEGASVTKTVDKVADIVETWGKVELFPEQQSVVDAVRREFFIKGTTKAGLQDGTTGSGKTYIVGGLLAECIKNGRHNVNLPFAQYLILTPKTVVEHYRRVMRAFGLGPYLDNLIIITSYSQLSAQYGALFVKEEYDAIRDQTKLIWSPVLIPYLAVFDECHRLANDGTFQTRAILALQKASPSPYQLFMSATPFVTVNSAKLFVIATRARFMSMTVTEDNFKNFAGLITREPQKPNLAAAKRLRDILSPHIFSLPRVKWPHKAINRVHLYDFANEADRDIYQSAYERYLENCHKAGKNTNFGRFEAFVALGQFTKTVEPLRIEQIVRDMLAANATGKAAVLGVAYRESVLKSVYLLNQRGIPREKISVIWGGKRGFKTDMLMSDEDIEKLMSKMGQGEELTKRELRCLRETIDHRTDRIMYNETKEQQELRLRKYEELDLAGTQSADQRQVEIDRFQTGGSLICIFTIAAGGVGLSLDHSSPILKPREVRVTPVWSGPGFKQALGRCVRRATLSDTVQYICYMAGTVEETNVAPAVDLKLKCIDTLTNSNFDPIDILSKKSIEKLRTEDQIIADSELEDSQIKTLDAEEEEDEDDENGE